MPRKPRYILRDEDIPQSFNEWMMRLNTAETYEEWEALQNEFQKNLDVVPEEKIGELLNEFDRRYDEDFKQIEDEKEWKKRQKDYTKKY